MHNNSEQLQKQATEANVTSKPLKNTTGDINIAYGTFNKIQTSQSYENATTRLCCHMQKHAAMEDNNSTYLTCITYDIPEDQQLALRMPNGTWLTSH